MPLLVCAFKEFWETFTAMLSPLSRHSVIQTMFMSYLGSYMMQIHVISLDCSSMSTQC